MDYGIETQILFEMYHIVGYSSDVDTDHNSSESSDNDSDIDVSTVPLI